MPPLRTLAEFAHPFRDEKPYEKFARELNNLLGKRAFTVSGSDSLRTSATNTLDASPPQGLRVLLWNIQDLGGGPSRGPKREEWVIQRIARILCECDPDVIVILEIKQKLPPLKTPKPYQPPLVVTRNATKATQEEQAQTIAGEDARRWARYYRLEAAHNDVVATGMPPGLLEVQRIREKLNAECDGKGRWVDVRYPAAIKERFTAGESYAFLVREGVFRSTSFELLADLSISEDRRAPALAVLVPDIGLMPRPLHVVGFHAPAPTHGEETYRAVERNALLNLSEFVFASDTNLRTESEKQEEEDLAMESLLTVEAGQTLEHENTPIYLKFSGWFRGRYRPSPAKSSNMRSPEEQARNQLKDLVSEWLEPRGDPEQHWLTVRNWIEVPENRGLDCKGTFTVEDWHLAHEEMPDEGQADGDIVAYYSGDFDGVLAVDQLGVLTPDLLLGRFILRTQEMDPHTEGFFRRLEKTGDTFHNEPSAPSRDPTRATSLRRLVTAAPGPVDGLYEDTAAFNANAYDKLEHVCRTDTGAFAMLGSYIYPLFERSLPAALRGTFRKCFMNDPNVLDRIAEEYKAAAREEMKTPLDLQGVLNATNKVSDHVPLILDLAVLTGGVTAELLTQAWSSIMQVEEEGDGDDDEYTNRFTAEESDDSSDYGDNRKSNNTTKIGSGSKKEFKKGVKPRKMAGNNKGIRKKRNKLKKLKGEISSVRLTQVDAAVILSSTTGYEIFELSPT